MRVSAKKLKLCKPFICAVLILAMCGCAKPTQIDQTTPVPIVEPPKVLSPTVPPNERQSAVGFYFDTVVRIEAYQTSPEVLNTLLKKCADYEALLSKTMEGSDVWRINHAQGQPVEVSEHTIKIIKKSQEVSSNSEGKFDITIAPATALWDFNNPVLPDAEKLRQAASLVDYKKIVVEDNKVILPKGMMIDLGGVAKGYIADEIARLCKEQGIKSGLLNFGGNVVVLGEKPDGSRWTIGLQNPVKTTGAYLGAVKAIKSSVVTSGNYERGFDLDGVRYHHILEPATGWPVDNELASVTIISESSMEGDALSTACYALGQEKAVDMLKSCYPDVQAVFIYKDLTVIPTEGIKEYFTLGE